jgi:hypothetical protein
MLIATFTLTNTQLQILLAFQGCPDTRAMDSHPMMDVDHTVNQLRRLTREGCLIWHDGDREKKQRPGYALTDKGTAMLDMVRRELERTLAMFTDASTVPKSSITGGMSAVAVGKATLNRKGVAVANRK